MSLGNNDNLQPNSRSRGNKRKNSERDCSKTSKKSKLETNEEVSKCPTKLSEKSEIKTINLNNLDDLKRLIKSKDKNTLIMEWACQEPSLLRNNVKYLHRQLSNAIQTIPVAIIYKDKDITTILEAIVLLYSANVHDKHNKPKIPLSEFVHKKFNNFVCTRTDYLKLMSEYCSKEIDCKLILSSRRILLNAKKKAELYSYLRHSEYFNEDNVMDNTDKKKLSLKINRNNILENPHKCLDYIFYNKRDCLKKIFFIKFKGEGGFDYGGPTREFLQEMFNRLIEVLRRDNLIYNEDSKLFWFDALCKKNKKALRMLGIVMGMALNHRVTLGLKFPGVFYKKLRGVKWELEDLKDVDKSIYTCLRSHLEYEEEDIYDVYYCTFQVPYYTQKKSASQYNLIKDEINKIVIQENKHEFVTLYSKFILDESIDPQFKLVKEGFDITTNKDTLDAFLSVNDLQQIFNEEKELDVSELQKSVSYVGFNKKNKVIRNFWAIVRDFTKEQNKSLLKFVSGSERLPIGGISSLNMKIQRHGRCSNLLPTSSTCFKILFLPEYCKKAKLREKLLISLRHTAGFGFQ